MDGNLEQTRGQARDKRAKFRSLAERRTNNALQAITRIGNLSNRQIYEYEEKEVRKIVKALKDAVASVEDRFSTPRKGANGGFKL